MKHFTLGLMALSLAACAPTISAVAPGPVETEAAFVVNASQAWTRFPEGLSPAKGSVLTLDGLGLNRVHLITVEDGDKMIYSKSKSQEYPLYAKGSSALQQISFVTDSLSRLGMKNVTTTNVTPAQMGGVDGTKFGLTGKYESGLDMKGIVSMAETDAGLNMIIYIAPKAHYYDKAAADVEQFIQSVNYTG